MNIIQKIRRLYKGDFDELDYIQMRLPVDKITPEFEDNLLSKIKSNQILINMREGTENDLESIIDLHDKAWHSAPIPFRPPSRKKLIKLIKDPDIVFLIGNMDLKDIGFILIYYTGENKEIGVIAGLGIIPEYQQIGMGTTLGLAAWGYFKERGVKELRCKVYKDNKKSYNFIKGLQFEEYELDRPHWKLY